ncbi:hypothetical protein P0136_01320 [Lentisphaerota bacterium ZTH]|nr:hypothetical protein JYG24_07540 [Lentisphaerota bacterium]WET06654.1 hypothetical protein P0136_01320 [Lentisphaerota bacterium ZTH]
MADFEYIFKRQHPVYRKNRECWIRNRKAYSGGGQYIESALIKHVSEVELEFTERRKRAYYLNYPRKIARLITHYVLSASPQRRNANEEIIEDFSRDGLRVNEVMRQFSTMLNVYGAAWMLIEMPSFSGEVDPARKQQERIRPYAVAVSPLTVIDWAYGNDGRLEWALIEENIYDSQDPFSPPQGRRQRRLWTREEWFLFEKNTQGGQVVLRESGRHNLSIVPLVHAVESDGFGMEANHWFEDVVRVSDAILNNESEAQMNIVKQMFGLLVISENFARGARQVNSKNSNGEAGKFSHVLARSAAIWESNDEKGISRYIAPGGTETRHIREENINLKKEMFDFVGMAVQKDSRSSQTAESKAWDNQNVRQFLVSRVDILEQVEQKCWELMHCWDNSVKKPEIIYNREFSVVDLKETMETLLGLNSITAGTEYRREVARAAITVLEKIKKISPEVRRVIMNEIEHNIK